MHKKDRGHPKKRGYPRFFIDKFGILRYNHVAVKASPHKARLSALHTDTMSGVNARSAAWTRRIKSVRKGLACIFSVILHENSLKYASIPASFSYNPTKNLTAQYAYNLCAVLP